MSLQKVGREKARLYFQKYLPEKQASLDSVINIFEGQEANWLSRMNQTALQISFIPVNNLINYLTDNKDRLVSTSSLKEWAQTHQYLEVMQQSLYSHIDSLPPSFASKKLSRDEYMWQNLQFIMDREKPHTKFMLWAYNGHISSNDETDQKDVGYFLRQKLKDKYYALDLECYEGTFQTRKKLHDDSWGDLKTDTFHVVPKSVDWYFKQTGKPYFFVDLRQAPSNAIVNKWMHTPGSFAAGYWIHRNADENFETRKLKGEYDGVLLVQHSTPVHPTKNALARGKSRIGF